MDDVTRSAAERLLWVVTGSVSAAFVPFHFNLLRQIHPTVDVRIVLTRSACEFVSERSLRALSDGQVWVDDWDALGPGNSPHVEWSRWADSVLVYPATLGFVARLAAGAADTPVMLAAQLTTAPIVLAPALPPGGDRAPAFTDACSHLASRPDVLVLPTIAAHSTHTGDLDAHAPAHFAASADIAIGGSPTGSADGWAARGIVDYASNRNVELLIRDLGSSFVVERRPGSDARPTPPISPPTDLGSVIANARTRLRWSRGFRGAAVAFTDGPAAAGRWLTSAPGEQTDRAAAALSAAVQDHAALVRRLEPLPHLGTPHNLLRLASHLADTDTPEHPAAAQYCGLDWRRSLSDLLAEQTGTTACFGDFGLGTIVPCTGPALTSSPPFLADLICGENVGVAAAGHDLGWLLGELTELRGASAELAEHRGVSAVIADILTPHAPDGVVRAALLRMALHLLDFGRFESARDDSLIDRWRRLGELLLADPPERTSSLSAPT